MENHTFSGCTDFKDPDGKLWCSTNMNVSGFHIVGGGFWGFCDVEAECELDSKVTEAKIAFEASKFINDNLDSGKLGWLLKIYV